MIRTLTVCALAGLIAHAASAADLPPDSIYRLEASFTDQSGREFQLSDKRGRPVLVAMFYTSCRYVCPLIVDAAKSIERTLTSAERRDLQILLVSLDAERDDVDALKSIAEKRGLDPANWTLARTDEANVRKLSALLGVRYRHLADGEFNHTSVLYLLDAEGRKQAESSRLGGTPDPDFVAAVRTELHDRTASH